MTETCRVACGCDWVWSLTYLQLEGDGEISQLWLCHAAKVKGFAGTVRYNHIWVYCVHNNLQGWSMYLCITADCSKNVSKYNSKA